MPADVFTMLKWRLPPMFILLVVLVKQSSILTTPGGLDFCELFAGAAEVSKALARVFTDLH